MHITSANGWIRDDSSSLAVSADRPINPAETPGDAPPGVSS